MPDEETYFIFESCFFGCHERLVKLCAFMQPIVSEADQQLYTAEYINSSYHSKPNKLFVHHITSKACVAWYVNSIDEQNCKKEKGHEDIKKGRNLEEANSSFFLFLAEASEHNEQYMFFFLLIKLVHITNAVIVHTTITTATLCAQFGHVWHICLSRFLRTSVNMAVC